MNDHLHLDRRDFVKLTLAGAAGAAAACNTAARKSLPLLVSEDRLPPGVAYWSRGVCRQCEAGCGLLVKRMDALVPVEAGGEAAGQHWLVAKKLEGNPDHPINAGGLCARGQAGLEVQYHPRRLNRPLRRRGPRGDGQFQRIEWTSAQHELASRLAAAGPGQVLWIGRPLRGVEGESLAGFLQRSGGRRLWHQPFVAPATHADAAALALLPEADVVVSFSNFLESWPGQAPATRAYGQFRRNRNRSVFLQIEPRLSLTAASADRWLGLRPGSEGVVALALAERILQQRRQPSPAGLPVMTVEQAAQRSGLSAPEIEQVAAQLMAAKRPLVLGGASLDGYPDGGFARAAVAALATALGQAPAAVTPAPEDELGWAAGWPHPPQVLFLDETDPLTSLPGYLGWTAWLQRVPFVVALQVLPDASTLHADLVLPLSTPLESWTDDETRTAAGAPVFTLNPPAMQRLHDTRSRLEILASLLPPANQPVPAPEEALKTRWQSLQQKWAPQTPFAAFWAAAVERGGFWPDPAHASVPEKAPASVAEPVWPPLSLPVASKAGDYPYFLRLYESPLLGSSSPYLSWLQETPDPTTSLLWGAWVEVHPDLAARLGVGEGDGVWVESAAGQIELPVLLFPGLQQETVAIPALLSLQGTEPAWETTPWRLLSAPAGATRAPAWLGTRVRLHPSGRRLALARFGRSLLKEWKHR